MDSLQVMVQSDFAPTKSLPPNHRLSIEVANKQEFSATFQHTQIVSRIYTVVSRAGTGVGKEVWG